MSPGSPAVEVVSGESSRTVNRAQIIGRVALWSFTGFLTLSTLAAASSMFWLLTPLAESVPFMNWHRSFIVGAWTAGAILFVDLMILHRFFVPPRDVSYRSLSGTRVHVGLTALNDEACIGEAVRDFKRSPWVSRVVVVDNDSGDRTAEFAAAAGADAVHREERRGYGACCMRALAEAASGADVVVLCEGDMTFSSTDIPKLVAYLENCDMVLGTRATQELRERGTQMDWLLNPANQIVAKLHQVRFWGTRLTDVGCTYRALRVDAYRRLAPQLWVEGNHFSPHMFIEALKMRMRVIEVPVMFRRRMGISKGVGSNKIRATRVALAMLNRLYRA